MEYLLKCYFEHFTALPRNSLHDRRKRRSIAEYITTLIAGCSQGSSPQEPAREAILAIIHYHQQHRADNGSVCMMGKYHNILYVGVRLCYDWQLEDTNTVVHLLEEIYLCEKSFERIFIGAIFGTKAPHYVAGWKSDFDNQEENLRAVVYFIHHATSGNLSLFYSDSNKRFIDIPVESCGKATVLKLSVQLGLPDKVHLLLRYGALILPDDDLIEHVLKRLMEFCHVYPYNIVSCLQLLLRAVVRVEINREMYSDLLEDGIIPLTRCGVPELKHLCRCAIRQRLWENYQLPNGIRSLSLPDSLQLYIDIMED